MPQRFDREDCFSVKSFKAADEETGEFEALVSVFGNVDLGGDRVMPGAFGKSLAKWEESGDPIPVIFSHDWQNLSQHIGKVNPGDATETDEGLMVRGVLDMDTPDGRKMFKLLKERRVKEFSFGYNVRDSKRNKDGTTDLLELDLIEVGPTLKGMNPATQLLAVKAFELPEATHDAEVFAKAVREVADNDDEGDEVPVNQPVPEPEPQTKAGARFSKETRAAIQQARDLLDNLLSTEDTSPAAETPKSATEAETPGGKASDADADLLTRINLLRSH